MLTCSQPRARLANRPFCASSGPLLRTSGKRRTSGRRQPLSRTRYAFAVWRLALCVQPSTLEVQILLVLLMQIAFTPMMFGRPRLVQQQVESLTPSRVPFCPPLHAFALMLCGPWVGHTAMTRRVRSDQSSPDFGVLPVLSWVKISDSESGSSQKSLQAILQRMHPCISGESCAGPQKRFFLVCPSYPIRGSVRS
jgi:hypothetical protein